MEEKVVIVKNVPNEGPGVLEPFFKRHEWTVDVIELSAGEELPETFDSIGAIVILGGPMNVYEEEVYPFLRREETFIRRALVEEVPILGICLGGQLLAKTCGAQVKKAASKEIGWYKARKTPEGRKDSLFRGITRSFHVFQWHGDTFDIPEGGVLLATGKVCRNQAFRVGQNGYGVQFHMEVTEEIIAQWFADDAEKNYLARSLRELEKIKIDFEMQREHFMSNYLRIAESSLRLRRMAKDFLEDRLKQRKARKLLWWDSARRDFFTDGES